MYEGPVYQSQHLRAKAGMGYLDFIRLVQYLWVRSHPDIPLVATTTKAYPHYPVITYRLEWRKPFENELKPRIRETIPTANGEPAIQILGQRFQNIITFTCFDQVDPHLAEEIIEEFENFMIEHTVIFKELGASEFVYAHRQQDTADQRENFTIVERSISYMLTTEKIILVDYDKLEKVLIDARVFMANPYWSDATPSINLSPSVTISVVDVHIDN